MPGSREARGAQWIHGGFVLFWILLWVVASITGWIQQVAFVSHLSIAALVLSSASGWQAARAEGKADENGDSS